MREIKFRCWIKKRNLMLNDVPFHHWYLDDDSVVIMQYTNLKDKNGKEIYEGDIFPYKGRNLVVRYELGAAVGHWFGSNEYIFFEHYANGDEVEVIGNIYENPELLKE